MEGHEVESQTRTRTVDDKARTRLVTSLYSGLCFEHAECDIEGIEEVPTSERLEINLFFPTGGLPGTWKRNRVVETY